MAPIPCPFALCPVREDHRDVHVGDGGVETPLVRPQKMTLSFVPSRYGDARMRVEMRSRELRESVEMRLAAGESGSGWGFGPWGSLELRESDFCR
eukprot:gene12177-biopygen7296